MKTRRHHNNKGSKQVSAGKTTAQVKRLAKKLGIKYGSLEVAPPMDKTR